MRKFYYLLLCILVINVVNAQVNAYVFSQSNGTYTPITGTVLETATGLSGAASLDSRVYNLPAGTIPFNFTFNGTPYTGLNINSNGFITFGSTAPSTTLTTPISSTTAYAGTVAAVARDLNALFNVGGHTGDIRYQVVGSAPNREFVIQWTNFRPFSSSSSATDYFRWNFQIRLRENNSIAIVYDFNVVGAPTVSTTLPQVGLRGATNADYSNRTSTSSWTTTTSGGTNTATVSYSTTNLPPSGLTFTWTPSSCFAPIALTAANVTSTSADISWTAPSSGSPTGYEYSVTTSATPPSSGTGVAGTSAAVSTLSGGTLYYLHVRSVCGASFSNWATSTLSTLSANDECASALSLTVNSGTTCTAVTQGSTVGSTQSLPGCDGTADDDVWFTFTATNVAHTIALNNITAVIGSSVDMAFEVFSGSCGSLTSIKCSDPNSATLTGLTPGVTYYLRVYSWGSSTSRQTFDVCVTTPPAAPANDECSGAINVNPEPAGTSCAASTSASTTNALPSVPDPSCTTTAANDDIWFEFTAAVTAYQIRFSNMTATSGTATTLGYAIYEGACGTLTQLHCNSGFGSAGAGISSSLGGFVPGNTYYVRLFTGGTANSATFDFCIQEAPTPPANDECSGAISITPEAAGSSCAASTAATTVNASQSPETTCTTTANNDDIWYTFTANTSAYQIRFSNMVATTGTATQLGVAIYSGSCGNLTQINCQTTVGTGGAGISTAFGGLTPGDTYYLRLWTTGTGNAATFNFCIQEAPVPPSNDECSGAMNVTPQALSSTCSAPTAATTVNATQSPEAATCTSTSINDDVWYTFTAGADRMVLRFSNMTAVTGTATTLGYAIYSGSCGSLTQVACNSGFGSSGAGTTTITGLTSGTTYYLRLFTGSTSNTATFNFCLQNAPLPANDECGGATTMPVTAAGASCTSTPVNTGGASESTTTGQANACSSTGIDDDVWYTFTTGIAGDYNFSYSNLSAIIGTASTVGMNIYTGSCGALTEVTGACSSGFGSSGSGSRLVTLAAGTTYTLRLFVGSSTNSGTFDFCITAPTTPPANDECSGAINVTTQAFNATCVSSTAAVTSGATASAVTETSCTTTNDNDDIWYTFTATGTSQILRFSNMVATAGTATTLGYQVFSGSCGGLTQLTSCSTGFGSTGSGFTFITGLTAGTTYYLRLFTGGTANTATFNFCIQDAPPAPSNDECVGATNVAITAYGTTCSSPTSVSTTGATQSIDASSCSSTNINDDVWYTFTATSSSQILRFSNLVATLGASTTLGYTVYSGSCGTLTEVSGACSSSFGSAGSGVTSITGLTAGTTYYLRLFSGGASNYATFDFCIQDAPLPPANDNCSGAQALTVNSGATCTAVTTGTTVGATQSMAACTGTGADDDVWYSFVATSPYHAITLSNVTAVAPFGTSVDMVFELFSGSCGTLTSIACSDPLAGTFSNLTVGATYYIRVHTELTTSRVSFDICVSTPAAPLANDDCSGATTLTIGAAAVTGATEAAYQSMAPSNCYASIASDMSETANDVWYKFTATRNAHTVIVTGSTSYDAVVEAFASCGSASISCIDATSSGAETYTLTGLTPGNTYYLRVYEYGVGAPAGTTFTIQVINTSVAPGTPGSCQTVNGLTVDAGVNSQRMSITDNTGRLVADIIPNGNTLGSITTKLYVHNAAVRVDNAGKPYLNRNFEITPTTQPTSPVTVRLYFTAADLAALQAAPNSNVSSVNDVGVFKVNTPCAAAITWAANPVPSVSGTVDGDYYVEFQVASFSSFFLASKTFSILPANILTFSGVRQGSANHLKWTVAQEQDVLNYQVERSENGRAWTTVGTVSSLGNTSAQRMYTFTDQNISGLKQLYRLRQVDQNRSEKLSNTIRINGTKPTVVTLVGLFPNPAVSKLNVSVDAPVRENVTIMVIDAVGKTVKTQRGVVDAGANTLEVNIAGLAKGTYLLKVTSETTGEDSTSRFVKE